MSASRQPLPRSIRTPWQRGWRRACSPAPSPWLRGGQSREAAAVPWWRPRVARGAPVGRARAIPPRTRSQTPPRTAAARLGERSSGARCTDGGNMQIKSFQLKAPSRERADHQNHKPLSTNERVHRRACRENVRRRAASCSRTAWSLLSHRNHLLQIRKYRRPTRERECSECVPRVWC